MEHDLCNTLMVEDDPDIKVILLGDSAVGKSKLVERFLEDDYQPRRVSVASCIGCHSNFSE